MRKFTPLGATIDDGRASSLVLHWIQLPSSSHLPLALEKIRESFKLKRLVHKERTTTTSIPLLASLPTLETSVNCLLVRMTSYVVDAAQCGDTLSVTVPGVDPVTMTAELTTAVSCHNAADGVITITDVSGGDGNYTFGISSNPTELSSDLVWEGIGTTNGNNQTYSFTVYDGNGCTGSSEGVLVTNPQAMFVFFNHHSQSCDRRHLRQHPRWPNLPHCARWRHQQRGAI